MKQHGRKSAAKLAVINSDIPQRAKAPASLNESESAFWADVVATKAPDFFDDGNLSLLTEFCRLKSTLDRMAHQIGAFEDGWLLTDEGVKRFNQLTGIQDRAQGRMNALARSLRLTNQSRFQPVTAGSRSKSSKGAARVWQKD